MALTTDQEAKVAEIIAAFDAGASVSELPDASADGIDAMEALVISTSTSKRIPVNTMLAGYMSFETITDVTTEL